MAPLMECYGDSPVRTKHNNRGLVLSRWLDNPVVVHIYIHVTPVIIEDTTLQLSQLRNW